MKSIRQEWYFYFLELGKYEIRSKGLRTHVLCLIDYFYVGSSWTQKMHVHLYQTKGSEWERNDPVELRTKSLSCLKYGQR